MQPKNWPKGFIYTPTSVSTDVHGALLDQILIAQNPKDQNVICSCIQEQRIHPDIQLKKITKYLKHKGPNPHPLLNQYGVFTKKAIGSGTVLGEYAGEYLIKERFGGDKNPKERKGVYTWDLTINKYKIYLYSGKYANEISFVNDYRGLAKNPNVYCGWSIHLGKHYLTYTSYKDISEEEEILVDYGPTWEQAFFSTL